MAGVHIGEMSSTVQVTDSQALLSQSVLEHIAREVLKRLREELSHDARVADERKLRPQVSDNEDEV
jgi:hypothetical protein